MKILIALCLVACSLASFAQSNTSPLTPEQRAVIQAAHQVQIEEMKRQMDEAVARSQANAALRAARLGTNLAPRFDTNPIVRISPPRQSYYNTNIMSPGLGDTLRDFEKLVPGFSTNFTPAQRALTNPHRNVIYRTNGSPELRSPPRSP